MKKSLKIVLFIGLLLLLFAGFSIYRFPGNNYWKPTLLFHSKYLNESSTDTEFPDIADANISLLKNAYKEEFYIIKKYRYSKDVWTVGYGGGGSHTDDYFYYGLANSEKNVLIPAQYESLHVFETQETGKLFVLCEQLNGTRAYYDVKDEERGTRFVKREKLNKINNEIN